MRRQSASVIGPKGAKRLAQVRLERAEVGKAAVLAEVEGKAAERRRRDLGGDVVDHEAADRRVRDAGERHAHQSAERGADPVEGLGADAGGEHRQVEVVLDQVIVGRVGQPVAAAAADEVGTDDAVAARRARGQAGRSRGCCARGRARRRRRARPDRPSRGRQCDDSRGGRCFGRYRRAAPRRAPVVHRHAPPVRMASRRRRIERSRLASSAPKRRRVKGSRV